MAEQLHSRIGEFTPDNLIAGHEFPVLTKEVVVKGNQGKLLRGTVVGLESETKLAVPVVSTATDGSQTPYGILTDNVDTASGQVVTTCYVSGLFNANALHFGGEDTAETHEAKLRELGIYIKENIAY